jgi:uncharacterized protein DUF1524
LPESSTYRLSTFRGSLQKESKKGCWKEHFSGFSSKQSSYLCHSLGNLLPLSTKKNSSLQNDCFDDKKKQKNGSVGYYNGSYSENKVALRKDWTPESILDRGLKLLEFLEIRWKVKIGDREAKKELLFLDFME